MTHSIQIDNHRITYDKNPDICPICHHAVAPTVKASSRNGEFNSVYTNVDVAFQCTQSKCRRMFIGRYQNESFGKTTHVSVNFRLIEVTPLTYKDPFIAQEILEISPSFDSIFKQATAAESYGLHEIAGVGYRKALEFLIKDYCIHKTPSLEESIKSSFLGSVINKNVDDANIKMCAERATWLGNDETHYVRKWKTKDINDLKILIELTCGWVKNNILTERYIAEMGRNV